MGFASRTETTSKRVCGTAEAAGRASAFSIAANPPAKLGVAQECSDDRVNLEGIV